MRLLTPGSTSACHPPRSLSASAAVSKSCSVATQGAWTTRKNSSTSRIDHALEEIAGDLPSGFDWSRINAAIAAIPLGRTR